MLVSSDNHITLRRGDGMKGRDELREAVRLLQRLLIQKGYSLVVDGLFGPMTEEALRAFQRKQGLVIDGIAGPQTWRRLTESGPLLGYSLTHPFLLRQLNAALPYRTVAEQLANRYGLRLGWIAGVCSRESAWGLTLRPPGPAGTGDWVKRCRLRAGRTGPLPPDGLGFGRGLMQIDFDSHEFARTGPWMDAVANLEYGCLVLREMRDFLRARITLNAEERVRAMLAAYNAGPSRVLQAIREGRDVDEVCAGGDYSTDALRRAKWFEAHGW